MNLLVMMTSPLLVIAFLQVWNPPEPEQSRKTIAQTFIHQA